MPRRVETERQAPPGFARHDSERWELGGTSLSRWPKRSLLRPAPIAEPWSAASTWCSTGCPRIPRKSRNFSPTNHRKKKPGGTSSTAPSPARATANESGGDGLMSSALPRATDLKRIASDKKQKRFTQHMGRLPRSHRRQREPLVGIYPSHPE